MQLLNPKRNREFWLHEENYLVWGNILNCTVSVSTVMKADIISEILQSWGYISIKCFEAVVGLELERGHNKENVRTWSSLTIDPWVRGRAEAAWTWSYFCPTLLSFLPPARRCCCSNITTQFQLQFQQQRVSSCSCCCCCCSLFREII